MTYRAYPDYCPSGSNALGELPTTWKARRLRFLVHGIDQGWSPRASNVPAEGDELGVLKLSAVSGGHFDASENKQLEEIPEGQVVLSPSPCCTPCMWTRSSRVSRQCRPSPG